MKHEQILRQTYINNVISLVANGGFEKATTLAIANNRIRLDRVQLNDSHIYRIFGSKAGLYAAAFEQIDAEILSILHQKKEADTKSPEQICAAFVSVYNYLLDNKDKTRYYLQYYYSHYFQEDVRRKHIDRYSTLAENMLIHCVLMTTLNMVFNVHNGMFKLDSKTVGEIIHSIAYCSLLKSKK